MKVFSAVLSLLFLISFSNGADPDRDAVTLFFSGAVRGNFEPCGCSAGPTGGLSRRAGYSREFAEKSQSTLLQVDAGNYFAPPGPHGATINALMEESLDRLPIDVLNLGVEDLHWWGRLSETEYERTAIISTNLEPAGPGLEAPAKYAVVEVPVGSRGSVKVGFLGLVDPKKVKPNSGFRGLDPAEAVGRVKVEVLAQADFLVVLADWSRPVGTTLPEDWPLRLLAEEHPEIYLILIAEPRFLFFPAVQVNSAVILSAVERGRYLGRIDLEFDEELRLSGIKPDYVELKEGIAEDPYWLEAQSGVRRRIQ